MVATGKSILSKKFFFFMLALVGSTAALANPYVNIETNAAWIADNYTEAITDLHLGYEGTNDEESASYYIQIGTAIVSDDQEGLYSGFSGKAGTNISFSESFDVYGEFYILTAEDETVDELGVVGKLGVTYRF